MLLVLKAVDPAHNGQVVHWSGQIDGNLSPARSMHKAVTYSRDMLECLASALLIAFPKRLCGPSAV